MKIFKILLAISLLMGTYLMAFSAKIKNPVFLSGTTVGKYAKPGLAVDMSYRSQWVDKGETSEIDILLTTAIKRGTMHVSLSLDKSLEEVISIVKDFSFNLDNNKIDYPINLSVSAKDDGLYYIRISISIEGKGMRLFAVPVHIGDGKLKAKMKPIVKTSLGENMTIFQAKETIER